MSLKQIKLASHTITDMYKLPLFAAETTDNEPATPGFAPIKYMGSNNKRITILVNQQDSSFLPDPTFNFLTGILSACRLTAGDIALVNIHHLNDKNYQLIESTTRPVYMLLFDVSCSEIGLPLQFPQFQVQKYNSINYLAAPALAAIEPDKAVKARLWGCLKTMFQI